MITGSAPSSSIHCIYLAMSLSCRDVSCAPALVQQGSCRWIVDREVSPSSFLNFVSKVRKLQIFSCYLLALRSSTRSLPSRLSALSLIIFWENRIARCLWETWSCRSWKAACSAARRISSFTSWPWTFKVLVKEPNSLSNGLQTAFAICWSPRKGRY